MSEPLSRAQAEIRAVLARAPTLDDALHAEDTLAWLLRLEPDPGPALALAALGHDIDRVDRKRALRREDFESYTAFRDAHAHRSAMALRTLLESCGVARDVVARASWLVEHHESGGDPCADTLRDADNLSWFRVSLPAAFKREGRVETLTRGRWGYSGLSPRARQYFSGIHHGDPNLKRLLREVTADAWQPPAKHASQRIQHG